MRIYRVKLDDKDNTLGLLAISLVDFPAVEKDFLKFNGEQRKPVKLTAATDEQRIITGVALLADTPIYRRDDDWGEYYIVFEREVIRQLVEKYSRDGLLNMINLQHDGSTYSANSCVMVESYFTDKQRGIAPVEFGDVPEGSWVVSFKVTDDKLWDAIKHSHGEEGGLNGFSVEVSSMLEEMLRSEKMEAENKTIDTLEELAEALGVKKKHSLRISKGEVKDIMRKDRQVVISIGAEENKYEGQIKDIGRRNGEDIMNFYNVPDNEWMIIGLDEVTRVVVTDVPIVPWDFDAPGYEDIINNDDIVITDSREASDENLKAAIKGQYFVMLYYDDESGEGCTGARQVQICAAGYHTGTGNKCFRAYEYFGATHTEVPAWKMFLTKRVRSFRLMTEADRWTSVPALYHMNDSQMSQILYQVDDIFITE